MNITFKILVICLISIYSCNQTQNNDVEKIEKLPAKSIDKKTFTHKQIGTLEIGDTIIIYNGKENGIRRSINADSLIGVIETDSFYTSTVKYCIWKYVNGRVLSAKNVAGFHMTTYYFNSKVGYDYSRSVLFLLDKHQYKKTFECANSPYEDKATDCEVEFVIK